MFKGLSLLKFFLLLFHELNLTFAHQNIIFIGNFLNFQCFFLAHLLQKMLILFILALQPMTHILEFLYDLIIPILPFFIIKAMFIPQLIFFFPVICLCSSDWRFQCPFSISCSFFNNILTSCRPCLSYKTFFSFNFCRICSSFRYLSLSQSFNFYSFSKKILC